MGVFKQKRKLWVIVTSIVAVLAIFVAVCAVYLGDYYKADQAAIKAFASQSTVSVKRYDDGTTAFIPENATKGFVFYPGGKVEASAYEPLMVACAEEGILCVLVEMPFRLAVLDKNAADGIQQRYPQIQDWYIGGHSLGGSMAASYLKGCDDRYKGLILLGAYSVADLSKTDFAVLSIYGSEDQVMDREKYHKSKNNLPRDFSQVVIDGGCHAYFGMYGAQDGDGTPTISNTEQIRLTAEYIANWMP